MRVCGDSLLQQGEECDDGNTAPYDGCSPQCKLYPYSGYDCDIIGAKCLSNCGWDPVNAQTLGWYILRDVSDCYGVSYYDYTHTVVGGTAARLQWIQRNSKLQSCVCASRFAQLPRQACTVQNGGCRTCNATEYHEDMGLSRCVSCGTACPAGYRAVTDSVSGPKCGPGVSTSGLEQMDEVTRNRWIGCAPCPLPGTMSRYAVSFIQGCTFYCNGPNAVSYATDSSNFCAEANSATVDNMCRGYYCTGAVSPMSAACSDMCLPCRCTDKDEACSPSNLAVGQYWGTCRNGSLGTGGIVPDDCSRALLPDNAVFTSAAGYGMRSGCEWDCKTGYKLSMGRCVACQTPSPQCPNGYFQQPCVSGSYCENCAVNTLNKLVLRPFETWATVNGGCVATCAPGAWLQIDTNDLNGTCVPCTLTECGLGEYLLACSARADSMCVACAQPLAVSKTEFVRAGSCDLQCVAGTYLSGAACVPCSIQCRINTTQSSECIAPGDRLKAPGCTACAALAEGQFYETAGVCVATCKPDWMPDYCLQQGQPCPKREESDCVRCQASICGVEWSGTCYTGELQCEHCPPSGSNGRQTPFNMEYTAAGTCVLRCVNNTALQADGSCRPVQVGPTPPPIATPVVADSVQYPRRALPHSNVSVLFGWMQP